MLLCVAVSAFRLSLSSSSFFSFSFTDAQCHRYFTYSAVRCFYSIVCKTWQLPSLCLQNYWRCTYVLTIASLISIFVDYRYYRSFHQVLCLISIFIAVVAWLAFFLFSYVLFTQCFNLFHHSASTFIAASMLSGVSAVCHNGSFDCLNLQC